MLHRAAAKRRRRKTPRNTGLFQINGPATECSSKARERLQLLLRIRPCPSTRRITAESQSQRGQAPLRIGSHSSSDQWIRHDFLCFFCLFPHVSENSPRANDRWQAPAAARKLKASANSARQRIFCLLERSRLPDPDDDPDGSCSPGTTHWH